MGYSYCTPLKTNLDITYKSKVYPERISNVSNSVPIMVPALLWCFLPFPRAVKTKYICCPLLVSAIDGPLSVRQSPSPALT